MPVHPDGMFFKQTACLSAKGLPHLHAVWAFWIKSSTIQSLI